MSKHLLWFPSKTSPQSTFKPALFPVLPDLVAACQKIPITSLHCVKMHYFKIGFSSVSNNCKIPQNIGASCGRPVWNIRLLQITEGLLLSVGLLGPDDHSVFLMVTNSYCKEYKHLTRLPFYSQIHQLTLNHVRSSDLCLLTAKQGTKLVMSLDVVYFTRFVHNISPHLQPKFISHTLHIGTY